MTPEIQAAIDKAIRDHRHDGVLTQNIYLNQVVDPKFGPYVRKWSYNLLFGESSVARPTNGATPLGIFTGTTNLICPFPIRIHAIYVVSVDTSAGNITLKNGASTITTIAKGTVAGAMIGAATASNTTVNGGAVLSMESDGGNVIVILHFDWPDN